MVLATRIPKYETRLLCAKYMQSFQPDLDVTLEKIKIFNAATSEVIFVLSFHTEGRLRVTGDGARENLMP